MEQQDTRDLIKRVRKIEIKTKGLSEQLFSGDYQSAFKGQGMSFSEVRAYQYGDDIRSIDWNVTARTGTPHIKIFEEERELTVFLLVDISPSVFTGMGQSHHELMAELCALLAFSAVQNNDKVGLLLFGKEAELFISPGKGKKHILRIIREILAHTSRSKSTHIGHSMKYLTNMLHKRSIVFVMSDFFSSPYEKALNVLSRRHDVIGLHVRNAFERQEIPAGMYRMKDPESGIRQTIDLSTPTQKEQWVAYFEQHAQETKHLFRKKGADYLSVFTNQPYITHLHQFFNNRRV